MAKEAIKTSQAKIHQLVMKATMVSTGISDYEHDYEYKVFSKLGDKRSTQYWIGKVNVTQETITEF